MKDRLFVSFSGGRTSAYMSWLLKTQYADRFDMRFVFANTGQEHENTLRFVRQCDEAWGLGVVWVEAVVHHGERKGTSHRIVTFDTASRDGQPFESMIQKFGIPNKAFPHCTRELKQRPMYDYIASLGWDRGSFKVAVGIRADEPRRLSGAFDGHGLVYPLAHWHPCDKQDVNTWWEGQPFNLQIREREGNCVWCWKKSDRKHAENIAASPMFYAFPARMERDYANAGAGTGPRRFFRGGRSTDQLFAGLSGVTFQGVERADESGGCSESCEAFATTQEPSA